MKFVVVLFLVASALAKDGDDGDESYAPFVHTRAHHGGRLGQKCSVDADCRNVCRDMLPNTQLAICYEGACFCMVPNK